MLKSLVYFVSLAVIGGAFVVLGTASLVVGAVGPGSVTMALGGLALIGYAGYTLLLAADPAEAIVDERLVWVLPVVAAALALWLVVFPPV